MGIISSLASCDVAIPALCLIFMEGRRETLDYVNEVNFHGLQLSGPRAINSLYAIATCMHNSEKEKTMFMIITQHYKTYKAKVFPNTVGQSFQVSKKLPQAYVEIHLGGKLSSWPIDTWTSHFT